MHSGWNIGGTQLRPDQGRASICSNILFPIMIPSIRTGGGVRVLLYGVFPASDPTSEYALEFECVAS